VCPLVLHWFYGQHYDAVMQDWPETMVFVFAPSRLARSCFLKALAHFQKGFDAVVLVQEGDIKHLLD